MNSCKRIRNIEKQVFTGYLALPNIKVLVIIYLTNPENMVEYYHNEQERQTVQGSGKSLQRGNKPYRII